MLEYKPWSKKELIETINLYKNGQLSILDIELSGKCNFRCVYCDSPDRHKDFCVDLERIQTEMMSGNIRWIFVCGLGEPTYGQNGEILLELLKLAERFDARCSIFTNLSQLTDEFIEYVDKGILYLLFKMDSLNSINIGNIYGTSASSEQLANVKEIIKHVHVEDDCTNLAASIVPTKENIDEIPSIVQWCMDNNIYPLIAELENAGNGEGVFQQLDPGKEALARLRLKLFAQYGDEFRIPICPAMVGGIHINHNGVITVDKKTGFSCHWFWLENPQTKQIDNFNHNGNWNTYASEIIDYRYNCIDSVRTCIKDCNKTTYVFGGCGGSIEDLLLNHLALHTDRKADN